MHNYAGLPLGQFGIRPGAMMAAADHIEIEIEGKGGHAARPHLAVDTILVGAQIINQLQSIVARNVDPLLRRRGVGLHVPRRPHRQRHSAARAAAAARHEVLPRRCAPPCRNGSPQWSKARRGFTGATAKISYRHRLSGGGRSQAPDCLRRRCRPARSPAKTKSMPTSHR